MTNCIFLILIHCMCVILCVVRICVYHTSCVRENRKRVLLFGTHLRKSLVIEGMCVICCVWYAFAHHHVCDSERVAIEREHRAFVWYAFA